MCVCVFVSISNHSVPTAVHKEDRRLKIIPCHPFVLFSRCFSFAWTKIEFFFHSLTLSLMLPSLTPPFRYFYFLHERKWHKDCINCQFCSILRGSNCSSNSEDDIFYNNFISSTLQPSLLIKCYNFQMTTSFLSDLVVLSKSIYHYLLLFFSLTLKWYFFVFFGCWLIDIG